jgi:farnesyl-diphosphate farnesyltransferase
MGAASKLAQLVAHPSEFFPVVEMALAARRAKALPALKSDPSLAFCYDMLNKVSRRFVVRFELRREEEESRGESLEERERERKREIALLSIDRSIEEEALTSCSRPRPRDPRPPSHYRLLLQPTTTTTTTYLTLHSFAVVIQQLPECLRDPVCVFYLVLRALDTVEDDMAIPVSTKVPLLRSFYERAGDEAFTMDDCGGPGNYGRLMRGYPAVARTFNGLQPGYRAVIADITKRMGNGMADFIERQDVRTVEDYDLYCHYVAGLVGVGLTDVRLFFGG